MFSVLDLGAGCWILDAGYSILDEKGSRRKDKSSKLKAEG